jgi:hypothetical protein
MDHQTDKCELGLLLNGVVSFFSFTEAEQKTKINTLDYALIVDESPVGVSVLYHDFYSNNSAVV